jgi:hypothetical protein
MKLEYNRVRREGGGVKLPAEEYRWGMPAAGLPPTDPVYSPGDILVAAAEGGSYQVSRVSANGRSTYVLGFQKTQPAALIMAARATSGDQRVFLSTELGPAQYQLVDSA